MRVERVITDIKKAVERIVIALDNRLTAQDNLSPTELEGTRVLTSLGPKKVPTWELLDDIPGDGIGTPGPKGDKGDPGPAGEDGEDGIDAEECGCGCPEGMHLEPLTDGLGDLIYVYDADDDLDLVMLCMEV